MKPNLTDNRFVRKILPLFLATLLIGLAGVQAQTRLKTAASAIVKNGYITETVVLADDRGELFLELLAGDRVAKQSDKQIYTGEILPPLNVAAPARAPRARMREILSFEVISDTNEPVFLIDQYTAMPARKRLRMSLRDITDSRRQGAQFITTFATDQNLGRPSLWYYDPTDTNSPWERLGGLTGETNEADTQVFSAFLYATGTYTVWDENPNPEFIPAFPIDEIELAEASPYPSVTEDETTPESADTSDEFFEELVGSEALLEEELNDDLIPSNEVVVPGSSVDERLIPAVDSATNPNSDSLIVTPVTTSQLPATSPATVPAVTSDPKNPTSNLQALPSSSLSELLDLGTPTTTTEPGLIPETPNEAGLAENLQANSFQNFGVNEGDLPEAGGVKFPWALLAVIGVIGLSFYAVRQKPY